MDIYKESMNLPHRAPIHLMLHMYGMVLLVFCCGEVAAEICRVWREEFVFQHVVNGLTSAAIAALYAHLFTGSGERTVRRVLKEY